MRSKTAQVPDGVAASSADSVLRREIYWWALGFGVLTILGRIPFLFRYDIYFQSGIAPGYLIPKRMLLGEFPIYTWGTDYSGIGPPEFLADGLMALFGPSIPIACFVSLLEWAAGVGLLVAFVGTYYGKKEAIGSGIALAVGVPILLMYNTQPFLTAYSTLPLYLGGFMWLTVLILRRGTGSWLCPLTALIMGWFWYAHKHAVLMWLSAGIVLLLMAPGREFLRAFVRTKMLWICALAFLIGYSPEILYKMNVIQHENRTEDAKGFLNLATPSQMAANWYMFCRCLPTYFDADPWSRTVEGVHYLNHMENWESFPLSAADTVGLIAAAIVLGYGIKLLRQSYQEKNLPRLLLNIVPVVNLVLILLAARAGGAYYNIRRYLMPAGVIFLVWLGIRLGEAWTKRQWGVGGVLGLMLAISAFHQSQLLQTPDELADYRRTAEQIVDAGYQYGISWYSYAHTLTALSNERVKFGILDFSQQSPYQKAAFTQEVVAVVWPSVQPPPFEFAQKLFFGDVKFRNDSRRTLPETLDIFGYQYTRIDQPRMGSELDWAPYRRGAPSPPHAS